VQEKSSASFKPEEDLQLTLNPVKRRPGTVVHANAPSMTTRETRGQKRKREEEPKAQTEHPPPPKKIKVEITNTPDGDNAKDDDDNDTSSNNNNAPKNNPN